MTDSLIVRRKRYDTPGEARFLTFSCFQRRPFLRSQTACDWLAVAIVRAGVLHDVVVHGYVFMPEHVHLHVSPQGEQPAIGAYLRSVKQSVAHKAYLCRQRSSRPETYWEPYLDIGPDGSVVFRFWQRGGGFERNVFSSSEFNEKLEYMHKNPVTRGLVESATDWKWSSAAFYAGLGVGPIPIVPPSW